GRGVSVFQDGKDPGALRTIGEVARGSGIRPHVSRYWEEQFPMSRPSTRAGGRRYYRAEDVALVSEIDRLSHREGYTIRGARQALGGKARGARPVAVPFVSDPAPASSDELARAEDVLSASRVSYGRSEAVRDGLAGALAEAEAV
ncbi:hypothetical protein OY671_011488, partial [Metschnikowia pulcherrima]